MTASQSAGTPTRRVGLCLDIDGTIHRHGSIFVETLAVLPYASELPLSDADRAAIRNVLGAVADYAGGDRSRDRWLGALRGCDALAAMGLDAIVARVLAKAIRLRARGASRSGPTGDGADYRSMQTQVLDAYGQLLRDKRAEQIDDAVTAALGLAVRVDERLQETLRERGVDVVLVTDVPTHVATQYAQLIDDRVRVVGTDFETRDGRFTGEYSFVQKGPAVERLRNRRDWDYVIAAGDSASDLPMARAADLFLAVAGRGNVIEELPAESRTVSAEALGADQLDRSTDVVTVPREMALGTALERTMAACPFGSDDSEPGSANESGGKR
ncbi:HAD family phosphatase [Halorhabdus sp. CUG00001]|uniref:HAD family hydrolase n=1 Tax=Halorhabdus sp. CUG00001 TaxID=2600297 RepID=UPI00131A9E84|nr:haloacid dehalogenase-like hydrolase [Halorhabdus sp. CUG00001]